MTELSFTPPSAGDDGYAEGAFENPTVWGDELATSFEWGRNGSTYYYAFLRFKLTGVSQNSKIASATLTCKSVTVRGGGARKIGIVADDDHAAPLSVGTVKTDLALLNSLDWSLSAQSAGVDYTSPDISSLLQNIVNRDGWNDGNHILIYLFEGTSASSSLWYSTDSANKPTLNLTFEFGIANSLRHGMSGLSGMSGIK